MLDSELATEMSTAMSVTTAVVAGIADEQLGNPTPCADYDVGGVLNHLMGVLTVAERAGRKGPEVAAAALHVDRMGPGWRERFAGLAAAAQRAWAEPAAWHGQTALLGRTFPAAAAGRKLLGELLVHGWDLARATGQEYRPDPAAVRAVHAYFEDSFTAGRSPGAWGPAVAVPDDAALLDRVLGLSGRDPGWTAGAGLRRAG